MDNVTHALAGCLLAAVTTTLVKQRAEPLEGIPPTFGRVAVTLGVITAELPDADLIYAGPMLGIGKLGYLLHHRGHTHTVLFAVASALLVWGALLAFWPAWRRSASRWPLLALALAGTLSHLLLDYTNSYGVHPFWPLDNRWFYGDAVFIVEPWLWIIALPPLFLLAQRPRYRVLFGVLLGLMLAAVWLVGLVPRDVAVTVTVGSLLWFVAVRAMRPSHRAAYALVAWIAVESIQFVTSSLARRTMASAVGTAFRDVALTPAPADPLCFTAQLVEADGDTYRLTEAVVAPLPTVRPVTSCGRPASPAPDRVPRAARSTAIDARAIRWVSEWNASRTTLRTLVATNCEVAAALRFMRTPSWSAGSDGVIAMLDERFGARGGFAQMETRLPVTKCPSHVPPWIPPRQDLLDAGAP